MSSSEVERIFAQYRGVLGRSLTTMSSLDDQQSRDSRRMRNDFSFVEHRHAPAELQARKHTSSVFPPMFVRQTDVIDLCRTADAAG